LRGIVFFSIFVLYLIINTTKKIKIMNYLLHTTIIEGENGNTYKYERLQQYNENSHKASNTYYCNNVKLKGHKRTQVKEWYFDSGCYINQETLITKRWKK